MTVGLIGFLGLSLVLGYAVARLRKGRHRGSHHQAFEALDNPAFIVDGDSRVLDLNVRARDLVNVPIKTARGQRLHDLLPLIDEPDLVLPFRSFSEPKRAYLRLQSTDSPAHPVEFELVPFPNEGAEGGLVLARPVGWEASDAMMHQERERAFRALAENSPDLIARVDLQGRRLYTNPAVEQFLGISRREALGKTNAELGISEPLVERWDRMQAKAISTGREQRYEWRYPTTRGERHYHTRVIPEYSSDNEPVSVLSLTRDITTEKENDAHLLLRTRLLRLLAEAQNEYLNFPFADIDAQLISEHLLSMAMDAHGVVVSTYSEIEDAMIVLGTAGETEAFTVDKRWRLTDALRPYLLHPDLSQLPESFQPDDENSDWYMRGLLQRDWLLGSVLIRMPADRAIREPSLLESLINNLRLVLIRKEIERAYSESEGKYRNLVERANDGIYIVQDKVIKYVNTRFAEMLGYSVEALTGVTHYRLVDSDQVGAMVGLYTEIDRNQNKVALKELALKCQDGSTIPVELNAGTITYEGRPAHMIIVRDLSLRKAAEAELRYLSFHDKLTGLYNRAYFEEAMQRLDVDREFPISLVLGDVNGLKLINDALGHREGDRLLKRAARLFKEHFRQEDIIARWGGDEFAIILPKTSERVVQAICERLKEATASVQLNPMGLSMAFGYATKTRRSQEMRELMKEAEARMYRDKLLQSGSARHALLSSLERSLRETHVETEAHARRMEELALKVGHAMSLSADQLNELALLASLHDIGKIAIPDRVILKPAALKTDEWEDIKRHPEIGYRIAQSSPDLLPIAEAILSHHEWYNGEGYPRGLSGDDIPLTARVVAVVDAYDVMVTGRPYREKVSPKAAVAELKRCAGTQFDPDVVEVLVQVLEADEPGRLEVRASDA